MSDRLRVNGIVLSCMPIKEYDRRIVLLTAERGRISAFAKGARRPKSQIVGATNPFVSGAFEMYEGRNSYTVYAAEIGNYFTELTENLELVWYGYYFLEVADYFSLENNDESERLLLLYQALRALQSDSFSVELVKTVYEFKSLVLNGDYPDVFICGGCGSMENLLMLSNDCRNVLCRDCGRKFGGRNISHSALYTLQYIAATPSKKLFSFNVRQEVLKEVMDITAEYYRRYVGHSFKSEEFLDL